VTRRSRNGFIVTAKKAFDEHPALAEPLRFVATCAAISACHGLPGFEPLTPEGANVRESDGSGTESCQFVGTFVAAEMAPGAGGDAVHHHLRNQAAQSGATVIVWDTIAPRAPTQTASGHEYEGEIVGRAYRCP
jgi:hypothetical protein